LLLADLYQTAKTARSIAKWSALPDTLKRQVIWELFKLRLRPLGSATSIDLLGYRVRFSSEGILRELFREIFVNGIYMFQCRTDEPTIVDCGSNIGMSILFFKRLYPKCRIIAFEPDPYTFEILSENVSRNALTNVELHQCALAEHDTTITLYRPDVENGSSLRMNTISPRSGMSRSLSVPAKRLSTFLPPHEVDLLKIDIEGAELAVVRELTTQGSIRRVRRIHLEYHHHLNADEDQLASMLHFVEVNNFGYQLRAAGPPWPSERVFQDMMIYCYVAATLWTGLINDRVPFSRPNVETTFLNSLFKASQPVRQHRLGPSFSRRASDPRPMPIGESSPNRYGPSIPRPASSTMVLAWDALRCSPAGLGSGK
jgi:FkbM family methyltransferase